MKNTYGYLLPTTILSLVLGVGGGVISGALTTNYLNGYASSLGQVSAPPRLAEERPRTSPLTFADATRGVSESVLPGVVEIYAVGSYAKAIASGAVLTTDGWVVAMLDRPVGAAGLSAVVGGRVHTVARRVDDQATGAVFLKLDATNLPVFAFGKGFDLLPGDQLFAAPTSSSLFAETLVESRLSSGPLSSDVLSRRLTVADGPLGSFVGAPVVNGRGELVGLVESEELGFVKILPTDGVLVSFNGLLRAGTVMSPSLGVVSTDLSRTIGLDQADTRGLTQGALLLGPSSVKKGGAAALGGLIPGDIILSLDGTVLDAHRSLDEVVSTHAVGDTLVLRVSRAGGEAEVRVTLGAL